MNGMKLKYLICNQAFVSYMRSIFLQQDKEVFDVHALPAEEFSLSIGLLSSPRIRFTKVIPVLTTSIVTNALLLSLYPE